MTQDAFQHETGSLAYAPRPRVLFIGQRFHPSHAELSERKSR